MANPAFEKRGAPAKSETVNPWLQGVLLGACIGGAFIGGWMLAKNGGEKNSAFSTQSASAVDSSGDFAAATPTVIAPVPVTPIATPVTVPAPIPEPVAGETEPEAPSAVTPLPPVPDVPVVLDPKPLPPPEPAQLVISTEPGAKVVLTSEVDEVRFLGVADKSGRLAITEPMTALNKPVNLIFEHPDCLEERREDIVLDAGKTTNVVAPLRYRPGMLAIVAEPATAEVFLNGVSVGKGFVMVGEVPSRVPNTVEVRAAEAEPVKRTVMVRPRETTVERISLALSAASSGDILFLGAMRTLVAQAGVAVLIDNKPALVEQGLIRNVPPGDHAVTIVREPVAPDGARQALWERRITIEPGFAISLDGEDDAITATPRPAIPAVDEATVARLTLTLLDAKGRSVPVDKAEVSFNGAVLNPLKSGAWPLPVEEMGTLRVVVPGFTTEERPLRFDAPGDYSISCVLQPGVSVPVAISQPAKPAEPAAPPAKEWTVRVMGISAENGLLVIQDVPNQPVKTGQQLRLVSLLIPDPVLLSVVEVKEGLVVCQILPGRVRPILPEKGTDAVVTVTATPPQ